ncbi:ribonuclease PH [Weizmannia acidilactici]|uniref:Ribonuclease PH n=1 Tax=Weizmannia acidilactici TaxID=2607726 RepID=A0A5J4JMH7_9BACI|nr:ribonuclease PH [Weizmannia acidilactici]GER68651.1 ribonuclease PH [Weizmannia acidilactici]GER71860.1 ribonuclease PH [Weizmannia acidilactici]GER73214.1 ribonuclease PH [Weizmannia acidilactici]
MRTDGREASELRPVHIESGYLMHPEGSVLISVGNTKVICTASVEDRVPPFLRGSGKGWIAAEYSMLPRATQQRNIRESSKGKVSGRTMEIQRLIGRALRAAVDLDQLGEKTIWVDCDVIQADGGTRTASVTGAFVAVAEAIANIHKSKPFATFPIQHLLAATSVGIIPEEGIVLDLNYEEDSKALVDMNVVMTSAGEFVELQGTGEGATFTPAQLNGLLAAAQTGLEELFEKQKEILGDLLPLIGQ